MPTELETVTLEGVEILSTGGPVHGVGSPPEGDYWTTDDLRAMAEAAQELEAAGEWRVATRIGNEPLGRNKLGHDPKQTLLSNEPTAGEIPAAGWLTNQRVSDDGTKLLADVTDVPAKIGALIKAKAYRTRSSELSSVKSQKTGKAYDWVVSGLAWLGGKMPAVRTLDDVVAMYGEALDVRRVVAFEDGELEIRREYAQPAEGSVVWKPEGSANSVRSSLRDQLNPGGMDGGNALWVEDVSLTDNVALVCQGYDDGDAWIVPFTIDATSGEPVAAPSSDWTKAEKAWVASAKTYADALAEFVPGRKRGRADTRPEMPTALAYTDEQKRTFADATGVELDTVTDEMLEKAGIPAPKVDEPVRENADDDRVRKLEDDVATTRRELAEERESARLERKRSFVDELLSSGKIEPGQKDAWEKSFDANEEAARATAATLRANEDLAREYGGEDGDDVEQKRELEEREYAGYAASHLGLEGELI